jgi:hypothetical protein
MWVSRRAHALLGEWETGEDSPLRASPFVHPKCSRLCPVTAQWSLVERARRVVEGCERHLPENDVLPLRRRLMRLEARAGSRFRRDVREASA